MALDLARALRFLHESKPSPLLHRDVKAEHVLVTADWRAKLTGFTFIRQQSALVQTQVGTPYWTAPEIFANKPYDCKVNASCSVQRALFNAIGGITPRHHCAKRTLKSAAC